MAAGNGHAPGFRIEPRTVLLEFATGSSYNGAEVRCLLDVPLGTYFDLTGGLMKEAPTEEGANNLSAVRDLLELFARVVLVGWNVQDQAGHPVSADADGMMQVPLPFAQELIQQWVEAVTAVPAPLVETSAPGSTRG